MYENVAPYAWSPLNFHHSEEEVKSPKRGRPGEKLPFRFTSERCRLIISGLQRTTQPTGFVVLYDFRELWQSSQSCKLL